MFTIKTTITIQLPVTLKEASDTAAREKDIPAAQWIRNAMKAAIAKQIEEHDKDAKQ